MIEIGDRVKCISSSHNWLSHRKGTVVRMRKDKLVELLFVQFDGNIQEQPFIFHEHELEKIC